MTYQWGHVSMGSYQWGQTRLLLNYLDLLVANDKRLFCTIESIESDPIEKK